MLSTPLKVLLRPLKPFKKNPKTPKNIKHKTNSKTPKHENPLKNVTKTLTCDPQPPSKPRQGGIPVSIRGRIQGRSREDSGKIQETCEGGFREH
jgi:hypothetical protein